MTEFKREERYFVIKYSDLCDEDFEYIEGFLERNMIERRECVVVESDWSIYDEVWKMIEDMK